MREVKDITAMSVDERIAYAKANSPLTEEELQMIKEGSALTTDRADQMVENVIGVYSLPYSIAPGFVINGKEMIVPMVGEEPLLPNQQQAAPVWQLPTADLQPAQQGLS